MKKLLFTLLMLLSVVMLRAQQKNISWKPVTLSRVVYYDIRESSNVNFEAYEAMRDVADFMRQNKEVSVKITGYADKGTGNEELNKMYAERRATQFKEDLIERYQVDGSLISIDSKGDKEQPFEENDLNRCVLIECSGVMMVEELVSEIIENYDTIYVNNTSRDTIYVNRTDTLWLQEEKMREEFPFGLDKRHRNRNWFVNAGIGPAIFQGDHNEDAVYLDRIYPQVNFSVGKWFYPALGARVGVDFDQVHLFYDSQEHIHWVGDYPKRPWLNKMAYDTFNFRADLLINLSSFIWRPYNRRIVSFIPFIGLGYIVTWDKPTGSSMSLNLGSMCSFRISEYMDVNVEIRTKRFSDKVNTYMQGHKNEGMTYIGAGVTWHFTKRGF